MKENPIGFQIAASEAIKAYNDQMDSIKSVKDSAKTILSSTSIIFALMSSFRINNIDPENKTCMFYVVGIITLLVFSLLIWLCIQVISPKKTVYPFKSDWLTYDKSFMGKNEIDIQKTLTAQYLDAIADNELVITGMAVKTRFAGYAMIVVVIGLILIFIL